eukprot:485054_1
MRIIKQKNIDSFTIKELTKKNIKISRYLQNIIGDYVSSKMLHKIETKLKNLLIITNNQNAQKIAETICSFPIDAVSTLKILQGINGKWIVDNSENDGNRMINNKLLKILQSIGIDEEDSNQICRFLFQYHVETIQTMIINNVSNQLQKHFEDDDVTYAMNKRYKIDYERLMIKLSNNIAVDKERKILFSLCEYLIYHNKRNNEINYHLFDSIYKMIASQISLCLPEWWCSQCGYHNRMITMFNKKLDPYGKLMKQCIVCGTEKNTSMTNLLKCESKTSGLFTDMEQIEECKLNSNNKCKYYSDFTQFMSNYSYTDKFVSVDILSKLSYHKLVNFIILPTIKALNNNNDRLLFKDMLDRDEKEQEMFRQFDEYGKLNILCITKKKISTIFKKNNDISESCITILYNNIIKQINTFLKQQQSQDDNISFQDALKYWKHALKFHSNDIKYMKKCVVGRYCSCTIRHASERRRIEDSIIDTENNYNDDINRILLMQQYYRTELDKIHTDICHTADDEEQEIKYMETIEDIKIDIHDTDHVDKINNLPTFQTQLPSNLSPMNSPMTPSYDDRISFMSFQTKKSALLNIEMAKNIMPVNKHKRSTSILQTKDLNQIRQRYTTDVGLYGFGTDHQHPHLGPHIKNNISCFKTEMLATGYVTYNLWTSKLIKAFGKHRLIDDDNKMYHAKQSSNIYRIDRGDKIGTWHILAICLYTDLSDMCTDYRSSYRRTEKDKNDNDVIDRFRCYYFLSRFLFCGIEFWGQPLKGDQVVFHGLNKELLFESFSTHFHAPMSTTPTKESVVNFAGDDGIILTLRNGNKQINEKYIISKFQSDQPRYLDVSIFSDFGQENEWLFFGTSIIFEVCNIRKMRNPKEIPVTTLQQLNLLQRIIKNKQINWQEETDTTKSLSLSLAITRNINANTIKYINDDEIDSLDRYFEKSQYFDYKFNKNFYSWYKENEYDRDSLVMDIVDGNKQQSNFYKFLKLKTNTHWFDKIYTALTQQKQERVRQLQQPYYLKLFHFFTVSQVEFISIVKPFDYPNDLALQLFQQEKTLSITKLTN